MKITRRNFLKTSGVAAAGYPFSRLAWSVPDVRAESFTVQNFHDIAIPTICSLCSCRCMMLARTDGKRLVHLEGNPKDPFTGGKICARGQAATKLLYDPDRLKYPLKRVGERGQGKWLRISWGEAIDSVTSHLESTIRTHGPESIAFLANGPSSTFMVELMRELGVENINNASYEFCSKSRESAFQATFGKSEPLSGSDDFKSADCIVLFGSHFGENVQVREINNITSALSGGAKLIVVDPRLSVMAGKADSHLMIRPGTDTALLLGWINYIIENKFYNNNFVEQHTSGLDALRAKAAEYPLERVSKLTDLPLDVLKRSAELIAISAPNVSLYSGKFSAWYGNDTQRLRALAIIKALLSNEESFAKSFTRSNRDYQSRKIESFIKKVQPVPPSGPSSSTIFRKVNKGQIKTIGTWGQNPFHSSANLYKTIAAYKKADFTFCCDILPTEAALYADIVFPEATFLERMDGIETWADDDLFTVALRYPAVEPMYESKGPYWIVKQLSSRLGSGNRFRFDSVSDRINSELKEIQLSVESIRNSGGMAMYKANQSPAQDRQLVFPTPSGKIELYSRQFLEEGADPLPDFESVALPPPGYTRLLNGRLPVHSGNTCNNPWLTHEINENELWLNDTVAATLKIRNGERLFLENQDGIRSIKPVTIKVTAGIRVDCVFMAHGFGSGSPFLNTAFNRGVSDGSLMTRANPDPLSGSPGIRVNFIRFVRAGKPLDIPILDNPPEDMRQKSRWWFDSFGSFESGDLRDEYV